MNNHQVPGIRLLYIICLFCSLSLQAQEKAPFREPDYNKPKLFNSLPASMQVNKQDLLNIVSPSSQKNQEIKLPLAGGRVSPFTGKIEYSVSDEQDPQLRTVAIQSTNFNGAVLILSSLTNADGTVSFVGRIFSHQHGDAFELQEKNNQYYWIKKNLYEMIPD